MKKIKHKDNEKLFIKPVELLAPAKNAACAISAINFGADAIYIGAQAFGARKNASNCIGDIKKIVDYARKFWVKVYVTINTILTDDELNDVQKLLYKLNDAGIDGIIVQDFGIFELDIPHFGVFASTQCDIRSLEKVKFFENAGLNRVILARELSLEQISEICKNSAVEIETFVHGALCVSYSGQCYLSYALGKRSANRGECAQPCRKKYTLVDDNGKIYAKEKHLLSLKDFCTLELLDDLIDAGVCSFKIEGRLKDENYVKNVVASYNLKLKKYPRTSSGRVFYDFKPDIYKSFNRGLSNYFLYDKNKKDIYNFETPKSTGEYLGKIISVSKDFFIVATNKKIFPQDGLCFLSGGGVLVNKVENTSFGIKIYPNKMQKFITGDKVFRNYDCEFEKILTNSKTKRQIRADFIVFNSKIEARDEDDNFAVIEFKASECANDDKKMKETFKMQLKKTGESDFYADKISFNVHQMPFLKISEINSLRRELLEKLMQERLKNYKRTYIHNIRPAKMTPKNNDYRLNIHNSKAVEFYKKCGVEPMQKSYELSTKTENAELMRTKHCLRRAFDMCLKNKNACSKKLYLLDEKGKKLRLEFDCKNCEMIIKE